MLNNKGKRNRRGQSTVEYIVLVSAVIAVMIVFLTNKNGGLQQKLGESLNTTSDQIGNMSDRLTTSQKGFDGKSGTSSWTVNPADNSTNSR